MDHKHKYLQDEGDLIGPQLSVLPSRALKHTTGRMKHLCLCLCPFDGELKGKLQQFATNLKLPHHKQHKGSVEDTLDDARAVGEFGRLRDLQIIICRGFKFRVKGGHDRQTDPVMDLPLLSPSLPVWREKCMNEDE